MNFLRLPSARGDTLDDCVWPVSRREVRSHTNLRGSRRGRARRGRGAGQRRYRGCKVARFAVMGARQTAARVGHGTGPRRRAPGVEACGDKGRAEAQAGKMRATRSASGRGAEVDRRPHVRADGALRLASAASLPFARATDLGRWAPGAALPHPSRGASCSRDVRGSRAATPHRPRVPHRRQQHPGTDCVMGRWH